MDFGSQFRYAKIRRSQDMLLVGPQADQLLNRTAEEITEKQLFRTGTALAENKMKLYSTSKWIMELKTGWFRNGVEMITRQWLQLFPSLLVCSSPMAIDCPLVARSGQLSYRFPMMPTHFLDRDIRDRGSGKDR